MKKQIKFLSVLLALCLCVSMMSVSTFALSFTDAHGNVIELDETLEAYSSVTLSGADNAARRLETNLGDLWTDALRWFAASGRIDGYFDEDDVAAGNTSVAVDDEHIVALWNGGNLRGDIGVGTFGAAELAAVLPYPNRVAVVYMSGAQLQEALEAASQGLPYSAGTADACASFMQVSGLRYTLDLDIPYDAGEAYGSNWYKADSLGRVTITEVNGQPFDAGAVYAVITSNANYNGMDSSYMFAQAVEADSRSAITTAVVRDIVWMYIDEVLENVVGEAYASPQGRITITGSPYADVEPSVWYKAPIDYVTGHGLMQGVDVGVFSPNGIMFRSMLVMVLYRIAGSPAVETAGSEWYAAARQWAMDTGVSDGTDMDGSVTREQVAAMLYRLRQQSGGDVSVGEDTNILSYADGETVSAYAVPALQWAVGAGVMQGSEGRLAPAATATRAEVATMLMRYCTL